MAVSIVENRYKLEINFQCLQPYQNTVLTDLERAALLFEAPIATLLERTCGEFISIDGVRLQLSRLQNDGDEQVE